MTQTRKEIIMDLIRKAQDYLAFLKMPPEENYDKEKVRQIIEDGDANNDKLYSMINNVELIQSLDVDEMTAEEVYEKAMSKENWIFMPGPKHGGNK